MNILTLPEDALKKFQDLLKSNKNGAPTTRVQYSVDQNRPIINDGKTKGFLRHIADDDFNQQNAYTIHVLETAICLYKAGDQSVEYNKSAALTYLSRLSAASASLTLADLGAALTLLLTADKGLIDRYFLLQNLADSISKDPHFVQVINGEDKSFAGKAVDSAASLVKSKDLKDGKFEKSYSGGVFATTALTTLVVPAAIIKKCVDLCDKSEQLVANKAVMELADIVKNPLARLMAEVLYANAWTESFDTALSVTLKVVGTGVSVGLSPGGAKFLPSVKAPASGLIKNSVVESFSLFGVTPLSVNNAFSGAKFGSTFAINYLSKQEVLKDALSSTDATRVIPPVFLVRKDLAEGMDPGFIPPGEGKAYNLFEKKLILSLLAYLSVPINLESSPPTEIVKARVMFKNILGSYANENCARPISYAMAAQEYVAERLGLSDSNDLDLMSRYITPAMLKGRRPVSFARLLCVSSGLVTGDSLSSEAKTAGKTKVWDGISYQKPGLTAKSQFGGYNMVKFTQLSKEEWDEYNTNEVWRHEQEGQFSEFTNAEQEQEGLRLSYLCRPFVSDESLNDAILNDQEIRNSTLEVKHYPYSVLAAGVGGKSRWLRDKEPEGKTCGKCKQELGWRNRHHCRCCGWVFCGDHIKKDRGSFIPDGQIKTATHVQDKNLILIRNEWICDQCYALNSNKTYRMDVIPLKDGSACVRPVFVSAVLQPMISSRVESV